MKTTLVPVVANCPKHGREYFNLKIITNPTLISDTQNPIYKGRQKVLTGLEIAKNVTYEEALQRLTEKAKDEAFKWGYTILFFNGMVLK